MFGSKPARDSFCKPRASRSRSLAINVVRLFSIASAMACAKLSEETAALVFAAPGTCCAVVIGEDGTRLCEGATVRPSVEVVGVDNCCARSYANSRLRTARALLKILKICKENRKPASHQSLFPLSRLDV